MRQSFLDEELEKTTDNYKIVRERWRKIYLDLDHEMLEQRFSLRCEEDARYIIYYNEEYRLDKRTGMLTLVKDPERELSFSTVMTIYHLFYYSKPGARVSGVDVPFRQVKRAAPFEKAFIRTILEPMAKAFEGHTEELRQACQALNGQPIRQGDVGYRIPAFNCMPLTIVFWDGDEEFPAQANILFDAEITDFLHEETVVCVASDLFRRLVEESGLQNVQRPMK